uniref:Phyllokininogen-B1 n=1 Tax=Phyllomedusa bicolor TaxID=8393 RepID=J9VBA8_PHYBI|nr:phyllokininogen-B1 [Phyllomedusa bicolor]
MAFLKKSLLLVLFLGLVSFSICEEEKRETEEEENEDEIEEESEEQKRESPERPPGFSPFRIY